MESFMDKGSIPQRVQKRDGSIVKFDPEKILGRWTFDVNYAERTTGYFTDNSFP